MYDEVVRALKTKQTKQKCILNITSNSIELCVSLRQAGVIQHDKAVECCAVHQRQALGSRTLTVAVTHPGTNAQKCS